MSALGVQGDPDGWTNAGHTIRAAASQLADDLDAADASGGSGLRQSWHGPMSDAYQDVWNRRYGRLGDLIYQAGRAATALIDFGEALVGLQQRAWDLERQWLGLGLHLSADGVSFALPFGHESLAQEVQATLHAFLGESERDIEAMWADIRAAVGDLVTVLESVIDALEDFVMIGVSVDEWVASTARDVASITWHDVRQDPFPLLRDFLDTEATYLKQLANNAEKSAVKLKADAAKDGDEFARLAAQDTEHDAEDSVKVADEYGDDADSDAGPLMVIAATVTAVETAVAIHRHGAVNGIEENLGSMASLATAVGIAAGAAALVAASAPVLVPVGVMVVGAIACAGVGHLVQSEADSHRKGTDQALTAIGHGIERASVLGAKETDLIPGIAS
jgi:uncharacterized protein YukE